MFNLLRGTPEIFAILRGCCEDNGINVTFCEGLSRDGGIDDDKVLLLKIDEYYSSARIHNPPPSIDFLVVVREISGSYSLYLIELRNTTLLKLVHPSQIAKKFDTTVDSFLSKEFSHIFLKSQFSYSDINAWLVTSPHIGDGCTDEQYNKKLKGTVLDFYQSLKPLRFAGKVFLIVPKRPGSCICIK